MGDIVTLFSEIPINKNLSIEVWTCNVLDNLLKFCEETNNNSDSGYNVAELNIFIEDGSYYLVVYSRKR